jgi:hypothetical protein
MNWDSITITLATVGVLTWLVFVLGICKFSKFYVHFIRFSKDQDTNMTGMGSAMKKMQNTLAEMVTEQRRSNNLVLELIDINRGVPPVEIVDPEAPAAEENEPAPEKGNLDSAPADASSYLAQFANGVKPVVEKTLPLSPAFVPQFTPSPVPTPMSNGNGFANNNGNGFANGNNTGNKLTSSPAFVPEFTPSPASTPVSNGNGFAKNNGNANSNNNAFASSAAFSSQFIAAQKPEPENKPATVQYFDPETQQIYHDAPEPQMEKVQVFDPDTQEFHSEERPVSR